MMRWLEPLVVLVGRLSYRNKLIATALVFGLPLLAAVGVIVFDQHRQQTSLEAKRSALRMQIPLVARLGYLHAHVAGRHGELGGLPDAQAQVSLWRERLDQNIAELARVRDEERINVPDDARLAAWRDGVRQIDKAGVDEADSTATRLIAEVRQSIDELAESSGLGFAADPATSLMVDVLIRKFPDLIDNTGRAGRLATRALIDQRLRGRQRDELALVRSSYAPLVAWSMDSLARVERRAAQHAADLSDIGGSLNLAFLGVEELLTTRLLNASELDLPVMEFQQRGAAAILEAIRLAQRLAMPIEQQLAAADERLRHQRFVILGIVSMTLLSILIGFISAYTSIMRGLRSLNASSSALAHGDLVARAAVTSQDELGDVANCFNDMSASFEQLIGKMTDAAKELRAAVVELNQGSSVITEASQRQSDASERVAAAVEELTVSIGEVAGAAETTEMIASQSATSATRGESHAREALVQMQQVVSQVDEAIANIRALEDRSRDIGTIIKVIHEIADQTNLLALNAAIEAARAGEAGRGFSVVADEVRKLADRTGTSTREIDVMVRAIQSGIGAVVSSMDSSTQALGTSLVTVDELAGTLNSMSEDVARSAVQIGVIVDATRHQREASAAIAQNVQEIAGMADENHEAMRSRAKSVQHLGQLADRLMESVTRFRTRAS